MNHEITFEEKLSQLQINKTNENRIKKWVPRGPDDLVPPASIDEAHRPYENREFRQGLLDQSAKEFSVMLEKVRQLYLFGEGEIKIDINSDATLLDCSLNWGVDLQKSIKDGKEIYEEVGGKRISIKRKFVRYHPNGPLDDSLYFVGGVRPPSWGDQGYSVEVSDKNWKEKMEEQILGTLEAGHYTWGSQQPGTKNGGSEGPGGGFWS